MTKIITLIVLMSTYICANTLNINILYLEQLVKKPATLSNVIEEPKDSTIKGIELAIKDSNKSARFLNQKYILEKSISYDSKILLTELKNWAKEKNTFVILNVQNDLLKEISDLKEAKNLILLNSTNQDNSFRLTSCDKNLLHTIPSNAMKSDALVQFLIKRNLKKWILLKGTNEKDEKIATSIKDSAKKFGIKILEEKIWKLNADIRRRAQLEIPAFTQGKDYDVVLTADFYGDFGEYLYFNTWLPRPIAGTQGLRAVAWDRVIEQWGAAQLQKRFKKHAKRFMNENDYSGWVATRVIVAAITKTKNIDFKTNLDYLYSKDFEMGAYKGRKLSFRDFNGQLRMPIALVHPNALVSTSPQDGFLHPTNDLDTLGIASFQVECEK
jgi:ABC transporter substrate binding protein (PQQ-dependent alcohol dehydrogenase system)